MAVFDEISRKSKSCARASTLASTWKTYIMTVKTPHVEVEIELKGEKHVLRKEFLSITKSKRYVDGVEVDDFRMLGVNLDEVHKPILAQSEIKRFVDTEQKDRWVEINKILGLELYNRLREDLLELKNKKERDPTATNLKNLIESISYDTGRIKELEQIGNLFSARPFNTEDFRQKIHEILKKSYGPLCSDTEKSKKHLEGKLNLIIKSDAKAKELRSIDLSLKEESLEKIGKIKTSTADILNLLASLKEVDLKEAKFWKTASDS
jgi:hypothetical protein